MLTYNDVLILNTQSSLIVQHMSSWCPFLTTSLANTIIKINMCYDDIGLCVLSSVLNTIERAYMIA